MFHVVSRYALAWNFTALRCITPYLILLQYDYFALLCIYILLQYNIALHFLQDLTLHYIFFLGSHSLVAEYAGQAIPGSPLVTDIYDANKVRIEGARGGEVNVPMVIDGRNWFALCMSVLILTSIWINSVFIRGNYLMTKHQEMALSNIVHEGLAEGIFTITFYSLKLAHFVLQGERWNQSTSMLHKWMFQGVIMFSISDDEEL